MRQRPLSFLVVDDSLAMRTMLVRALNETSLPISEIVQAADGAAALKLLDCRGFDLVMLDLSMPLVRGDQVVAHLRSQPATARQPVVVISSEQSTDCVRRMHAANAVFVRKPFVAADIEAAILAALDVFSNDSKSDCTARDHGY